MLLSCEIGFYFFSYNWGSPHFWKEYIWCNGNATACLELPWQCVEILRKKQYSFESIDNCLEIFV